MKRQNITKKKFEDLIAQGFGVRAMAAHFGVCPNTMNHWVKATYGKTCKQFILDYYSEKR